MFHIQQVFSSAYADRLAKQLLNQQFRPSTIYPAGTDSRAAETRNDFRTSEELVGGFMMESGQSQMVCEKVRRAAASFGVTEYQPETDAWNVLRYDVDQQFKLHTDCWDAVRGEGRNQRVLTALIVLQQSNEGGETVFPNLGLEVRPPAGYMIVWHNTTGGGCNNMLLHGGMPPVNGSKLVMTKWYRGVDNGY